jgi:hypothetical protein
MLTRVPRGTWGEAELAVITRMCRKRFQVLADRSDGATTWKSHLTSISEEIAVTWCAVWPPSGRFHDHLLGRRLNSAPLFFSADGQPTARARSGQKEKEPLWGERPSLREARQIELREANGGRSRCSTCPPSPSSRRFTGTIGTTPDSCAGDSVGASSRRCLFSHQ